ncbi:uncharacterized protein LOC131529002 [Onychostoma macrolepis]|uniref:Uncharacterized protein n=1 Tax=Onychostoma macrolepis TaxID=369639 RepID=A0A7J6BVK5_9TELE|nr:uncharacterized protein LOC131529002 [Onychostoma macrolepis]XP_058614489.1 uncharacterized protein LOC131529002 [Onychostoma macrolepis]KAF4099017.1 hypothetical protein G5714_021047 [Onychostoma macrolepis]
MDDIATLIKEVLPTCSTPDTLQPILDALQNIGVETVDDMKLVQKDDLAGVLKPIQARKLLAHVNSVFSASGRLKMEEYFPVSPQTIITTPRVSSSPSPNSSLPVTSPGSFSTPTSSQSDTDSTHSATRLSSDWHYNFKIPWDMLPAVLRKKLDNQEQPTAREMIRIISGEILAICQKPLKKHLNEIARKMVLEYPKSLKDVIEDEVVGSGHDSLTKQLQCRVDNYKRNETLNKRNSTPADDTSTVPENKKKRKDSYGCIVLESVRVNMDAQMKKKKEIQEMFMTNDRNEKRIQELISDTFISQRSDIRSGKDTHFLKEEWPYLFSLVGMKEHFKLLTGVQLNEAFEEATTTKFARVLDYFQSLPIEKSVIAAKDRAEIQLSGGPSGAVLMLLSHFKEDCTKMFHIVDKKCIADEVETDRLPPTPCIIVCGTSPLSAAAFMVAADQEVIIEHLTSFNDALVSMFICYYIFNMHYPVELGATLEFLQRCIFKINPDKGSKVERLEKKKSHAVNPKVLTLITRRV